MPNWWEKGNAPGGDDNHSGDIGQGWRDGMGIGFTTIAEGGLYPFFLSSAFSARNFVMGSNDAVNVEIDILWSFLLSVIVSVVIGYYLQSTITIVWGIAFGVTLSLLYLLRGGLLKLPIHIPLVTPKMG